MNIQEFVESPFGLNMGPSERIRLFPVQQFILKCYYNLELNSSERTIRIPKNWRDGDSAKAEHFHNFTEAEYMGYLFNEGRCNIREPDHERHRLILPIGRRSGKSFISSIIGAYEIYRLLRKFDPQRYYGMAEGAEITLSTVAPTKDQSQILYNAIRNHFVNCDFFTPFLSHDTQSFMRFQTPHDIEETGSARDDGRASCQIRFFSSSSSGIRGYANIVVILDEVAFFKDKGGSSAQSVYSAVTPSVATFGPSDPNQSQTNLTSHSEGRVIMISSPSAKSGLFYNSYSQSKAGGPPARDLLMIQAPTWEVNPQVPISFLEDFQANDPTVFATEFGAEFTDRVSSWIERKRDLMVCVLKDLKPEIRGRARQAHYMGLDLAVVSDRTSLVLTRPEADGIRLIYHEEWQAGHDWYDLNPHLQAPMVPYAREIVHVDMLDFDEMAAWVKEVSRKFYVREGLFDQWQGLSFQQTLDKMGLEQIKSKQFTKDHTSQMFDAFKALMYHGKLELYDYMMRDVNTEDDNDTASSVLDAGDAKNAPYITELLELRATRKSKKIIEVEAPQTDGKHDDFSDALVRSVWLSAMATGKQTAIAGRGARGGSDDRPSGPTSVASYQRRKSRHNNYTDQRGGRLKQIERWNRRRR